MKQPPKNPVERPDLKVYYRPTEPCVSDETAFYKNAYPDFGAQKCFIVIYSRVTNKPIAYFNRDAVIRIDEVEAKKPALPVGRPNLVPDRP